MIINHRSRYFCLLLSGLLMTVGVGRVFAAESLVVLPGHISPRISVSTRLEVVASTEVINLSLVVNIDQTLMSQTLAQLYGPNASANKTFLTPAQFAQKFNLAQKRQLIKAFAEGAGLTLSSDDEPNSLIVKVSGPASIVQNAFSVHLYHYLGPDGQVFRANDSEPMIPASLVPHLGAVIGLSNFHNALKPHVVLRRPQMMGQATPSNIGSGPGGGLAPTDIESIYGLSGTLNGSGQTLALLELDGYNPSDISLYESQFSLPNTPVAFMSVDGQTNLCGSSQNLPCNASTASTDNGMTEVALDIEMMIALDPDASNILVYTAPNTNSDALNAYSAIAANGSVGAISTSWGEDEETATGAYMASENTVFQQMATQGQTIFSAAGDAGAYDASGTGQPYAGNLLTDDPASQPYVTGVGGTSLSGNILSHTETVWNNGCSNNGSQGTQCAANGAGGGGVANYASTYWPIPSYQNGVSGIASSSYRNVPDVSLNADPQSAPYSICVGGSCSSLVGGTSAASPLWAALAARINQQRAINRVGSLGFANPPIYQLATSQSYGSAFNDITSGNNGFYNAGTGYDNASGWGSFKGNDLISALSNGPPQNVAASMIGTSSITWTWTPVVAASSYNVYGATDSLFLQNVTTTSFTLSGLLPNTTEEIEVYAVSASSQSGPPSAASIAVTLAAPISGSQSESVFASSVAVTYQGCSPSSYCAGYEIDASTDSGFSGTIASTITENPALSALTVSGLFPLTTYYLRLGSLNWSLAPNYISITSTETLLAPETVQVVTSTGGVVTFLQHSGPVTLNIPSGAFNSDTTISVDTSVFSGTTICAMPPGRAMTDEGVGVDISLNPDIVPAESIPISISYANVFFPSNVNQSTFLIARCDANVGVWIPLVSNANVSESLVSAVTDRFSTFEIMGYSSGTATSVKEIEISNNPIRPSRGITNTTFSNLPANSRLRIYTISGLIVKDISADATGVATWDATNQSGRMVASGVYFIFVQGNGTEKTLKIAVQR